MYLRLSLWPVSIGPTTGSPRHSLTGTQAGRGDAARKEADIHRVMADRGISFSRGGVSPSRLRTLPDRRALVAGHKITASGRMGDAPAARCEREAPECREGLRMHLRTRRSGGGMAAYGRKLLRLARPEGPISEVCGFQARAPIHLSHIWCVDDIAEIPRKYREDAVTLRAPG